MPLSDLTVPELKKEARAKGIRGFSTMRKEQLIRALSGRGMSAAPKRVANVRKPIYKKTTGKSGVTKKKSAIRRDSKPSHLTERSAYTTKKRVTSLPKTRKLLRGTTLTHVTRVDRPDFVPDNKLNWFSTDPNNQDRSFGRYRYTYITTRPIDRLAVFDFSGSPEGDRLIKTFERYIKSTYGIDLKIKQDKDLADITDWGFNGFIDLAGIGGDRYPDVILPGYLTTSLNLRDKTDLGTDSFF